VSQLRVSTKAGQLQLLVFYEWVPDEHICEGLKEAKTAASLEGRSLASGESVGAPWGFNVVVDTSGPILLVTTK
jgi:hypothetical protein